MGRSSHGYLSSPRPWPYAQQGLSNIIWLANITLRTGTLEMEQTRQDTRVLHNTYLRLETAQMESLRTCQVVIQNPRTYIHD